MFSMSAICERKEKTITRNMRYKYYLGSVLFFQQDVQSSVWNTHQEK